MIFFFKWRFPCGPRLSSWLALVMTKVMYSCRYTGYDKRQNKKNFTLAWVWIVWSNVASRIYRGRKRSRFSSHTCNEQALSCVQCCFYLFKMVLTLKTDLIGPEELHFKPIKLLSSIFLWCCFSWCKNVSVYHAVQGGSKYSVCE